MVRKTGAGTVGHLRLKPELHAYFCSILHFGPYFNFSGLQASQGILGGS